MKACGPAEEDRKKGEKRIGSLNGTKNIAAFQGNGAAEVEWKYP